MICFQTAKPAKSQPAPIMSSIFGSAQRRADPHRWSSAICPRRTTTASSTCMMISERSSLRKESPLKRSPISTRQKLRPRKRSCSARFGQGRSECSLVPHRKWVRARMFRLSWWHSIIWIVPGVRLICSSGKAASSGKATRIRRWISTPM